MKIFVRFSAIILVAIGTLTGCGKKPDAAAQEVCQCFGEAAKSAMQNPGDAAGKTADCQKLAAKYQSKFSRQEQAEFAQATASCLTGR